MSDSKLAQFLATKKIDVRRLMAASSSLEGLTIEDRAIRLAKRQQRKGAADAKPDAVKETRKPRSGRPVTQRAIDAALSGGTLSGPTKTRILRAVNHLLEQKKQEKIDLRVIF